MKKIGLLAESIIFFTIFILTTSCTNRMSAAKQQDDYNNYSYGDESEQESEITESDKEIPVNILPLISSDNVSSQEEVKTEQISNNEIKGSFNYTDEERIYIYEASVEGDYRFDFDTTNATQDYEVEIIDQKQKTVALSNYQNDSEHPGITVELKKGEHRIIVRQKEGYPDYIIRIGKPNKTAIISDKSISQKVNYINQKDRYMYIAPISGKYCFTFSSTDATAEYTATLSYKTKKEIFKINYPDETGKSVDLEKGDQCIIAIRHNSGDPGFTYSIDIGVPNKTIKLENTNTIKGSLEYNEQINSYEFSPKISGDYVFFHSISDKEADYTFEIKDYRNGTVIEKQYKYMSDEICECSLTANKKYTIYVKQCGQNVDYEISFLIKPLEELSSE